MDINAIAAALAVRYASLTQPSGEAAIVTSTATMPDTITNTPYVLVMAAVGQPATFERGTSTRLSVVPFTVNFYLDKASDLARQSVRLQKWAGILLEAPLASVQLGGLVATTWTSSFQIGDLDYGGQLFAAIQLTVLITISEGISPVA